MLRPQTYTYQQVLNRQGQIDPNIVHAIRADGKPMAISAPIPSRGGVSMPSSEWRQYQAWLEEGNTPKPPNPVPGAAGKLANVPIPSDDPLTRLEQRVTQLEQDNG